jgi:hypothetical protein
MDRIASKENAVYQSSEEDCSNQGGFYRCGCEERCDRVGGYEN